MANPTQTQPARQPASTETFAHPPIRVRFSPPSYPGKYPDTKPNVADCVMLGAFGALPIQLAGFSLQLDKASRSITVFHPSTSRVVSAVAAVQPARESLAAWASRMKIDPATVDLDQSDMPMAGAKQAVAKLEDAIRDAWARCNAGGSTQWGTEIPLAL